MSNYSTGRNLFTMPDTNIESQIDRDTTVEDTASGKTTPEIIWMDSNSFPRVNIYAFASKGNVFFLPDGGEIQFFKHDKPIEFYAKQACLVRNRGVPGGYVIRVPAGTPVYRIADYRDMFEARKKIEIIHAEYTSSGPYVHEREVGINCGFYRTSEASTPLSEETHLSHNSGHAGDYFFAPDFAVYPQLINRVQSFLDSTVSPTESSLAGSDDCNADGSTSGSSECPGSANELFAQRLSNAYETAPIEMYENDNGNVYDLRANSGGYGRMFPMEDDRRHVRHYASQSYQVGVDSTLNRGHGQHGSFIPVLQAGPANDAPASLPPRHLNKKTNALYKTEMCRNWNEIGECRYGRSCQFAHGKKELRTVPRHGQWKTKTCMAWLHGGCTYGSRCCYAHEIIEDNGRGHNHSQSPASTEPSASNNLGDAGESKFSEFFASRCWA